MEGFAGALRELIIRIRNVIMELRTRKHAEGGHAMGHILMAMFLIYNLLLNCDMVYMVPDVGESLLNVGLVVREDRFDLNTTRVTAATLDTNTLVATWVHVQGVVERRLAREESPPLELAPRQAPRQANQTAPRQANQTALWHGEVRLPCTRTFTRIAYGDGEMGTVCIYVHRSNTNIVDAL